MSKTTTVAVYGSLRKTMGNHRVLDGATFLGLDTIVGMGMVSLGGYPACDFEPKSKIVVELYEVDNNGLRRLDALEGCDGGAPQSESNYYSRREVKVEGGVSAWVYYIPEILQTERGVISNGDWVDHRNLLELGDMGVF